jgi:hypothetical protein
VLALAIDLWHALQDQGRGGSVRLRRGGLGRALMRIPGLPGSVRSWVATDTANARAYRFARQNYMTGGRIDSSEVTVQGAADSSKVRVWVRRAAVQTWFAGCSA